MITTTSARFNDAMLTDHDVVSYFEIWQGQHQMYSSLTAPESSAIIDGNVTLTKDQDARGQCSVVIVSPDGSLVPTQPDDLLTPWGNEIRLYSGVHFPDGTEEYVPLGCYRISSVQMPEQKGAIQMTVAGSDRSRNISRNVIQRQWPDYVAQNYFLANTTYPGNTWASMIQQALRDRYPGILYNDTIAQWAGQMNDPLATVFISPTLPGPFTEGTDMWSQMRQYAQAAGTDLFFDRLGVCNLKTDPVLNFFLASFKPTPVASFVEGASCTFDQIQRNLTDQSAYNRVIVYGSGNILGQTLTSLVFADTTGTINTAPGPLGNIYSFGLLADDNDPSSPTYIGQVETNPNSINYGNVIGPSNYGVVTQIVNNNLLVSQTQVNNFATLTLHLAIGAHENVAINSMLTDPRLEIDDVVEVTRQRTGVNGLFLIESLTIPLSPKSTMQMTIREKRNRVPTV